MIKPTTKRKQRDFIDALIFGIRHGPMTYAQIVRQLHVLRAALHNRPPVKKGERIAQSVTPTVRRKIVAMYRRNRRVNNQTIAERLNLNPGRVSEVLAGKRR
jgi:hypothetical protein